MVTEYHSSEKNDKELDEQRIATGTNATFSKQVAWYTKGAPKLQNDMKILLMQWSGIEPENGAIERHVEKVRDEAWKIHPYPCIGGYRFLILGLAAHPSFGDVVSKLKAYDANNSHPKSSNPQFLDLGCCVGQDIRSLVYAGAPGSSMVGVEVEPAFVQLGFDLFQDKERIGAHFLNGDILTLEAINPAPSTATETAFLSSSSPHPLSQLIGRISIVWTSAFLHLWDLPGQIAVCHKILLLLRDEPGVKILGRQVGARDPILAKHVTNKGGLMFRHNPESFRKMWEDVLGQPVEGYNGTKDNENNRRDKAQSHWVARAWFEEDLLDIAGTRQEAGLPLDSAWVTKVAEESKGTNTAGSGAGNTALFLVWEVERLE